VEENKAFVRRFLENGYQEALRGNLDVVHQYFADHYHDRTPMHPEQVGVHGVKELIGDCFFGTTISGKFRHACMANATVCDGCSFGLF
jgi:hypothetical protein